MPPTGPHVSPGAGDATVTEDTQEVRTLRKSHHGASGRKSLRKSPPGEPCSRDWPAPSSRKQSQDRTTAAALAAGEARGPRAPRAPAHRAAERQACAARVSCAGSWCSPRRPSGGLSTPETRGTRCVRQEPTGPPDTARGSRPRSPHVRTHARTCVCKYVRTQVSVGAPPPPRSVQSAHQGQPVCISYHCTPYVTLRPLSQESEQGVTA